MKIMTSKQVLLPPVLISRDLKNIKNPSIFGCDFLFALHHMALKPPGGAYFQTNPPAGKDVNSTSYLQVMYFGSAMPTVLVHINVPAQKR